MITSSKMVYHNSTGFNFRNGFLICSMHGVKSEWCTDIQELVEIQGEVELIEADHSYQVPIFPSERIFAEIQIGELVTPAAAPMTFRYVPDFGKPFEVPLGFWNKGEGFLSIRAVVVDYIKSYCDPDETWKLGAPKTKCPFQGHGILESRIVSKGCENSMTYKWVYLWNVILEKACTECLVRTTSGPDNNFGIDESILPRGRN